MTLPIVSRERVKRAVEDALDGSCYGDLTKAIAHAAASLCLPVQAVEQALQPADFYCCEQGENLGVPVCDECAEFDALIREAFAHLGVPVCDECAEFDALIREAFAREHGEMPQQ